MQQEAHIAGIGTAVPYPISTEQMLAHDRAMRERHGQSETIINRVAQFVRGSGIHTRHYSHPHWLPEGTLPEDFPDHADVALDRDIFTPSDFVPSHEERMTIFDDTVLPLTRKAARRAIDDWGGRVEDITHVITTCTSGWHEPGIAVDTIHTLGLPLDIQKAELNFNGCFCGATCLRLARDAIRAGAARNVLVIAVEVASTHYDLNATDPSSLVAHSLFADGAAAMVIGRDGPWRYTQTGMSLVANSHHLLQLAPPKSPDHLGYRMVLDRHVGQALRNYFSDGDGYDLLERIVGRLRNTERPALGVHPGGPNILDNVAAALDDFGWDEDPLRPSYETLYGHGNLGCAAMLFVLAERLARKIEQQELLTMAFGPGVTVEWATLARS